MTDSRPKWTQSKTLWGSTYLHDLYQGVAHPHSCNIPKWMTLSTLKCFNVLLLCYCKLPLITPPPSPPPPPQTPPPPPPPPPLIGPPCYRSRIRIWRTGWYTPIKNSDEYMYPPGYYSDSVFLVLWHNHQLFSFILHSAICPLFFRRSLLRLVK